MLRTCHSYRPRTRPVSLLKRHRILYLVKNNLWPKQDQTSLFKCVFTKLFGERFGRKDREHSKEVSLCNLGCAVEYLFSKALLEFELELLKRADVERLR
jgi:hypothetical protein